MSEEVAPLAEFAVAIGDDKFDKYLKIAKLGKHRRAGLDGLTKAELEAAIREKLGMSYLYNMDWVDEDKHRLRKFNIMLELSRQDGPPKRMVVVLECRPIERILKLITVF